MDLLQKVTGFFKTPEPTTEEQAQKTRNELFARQQGYTTEIEKLQARNTLLDQQFRSVPENSPYAAQLYVEIRNNNKQITSLQNQRTLVTKSLENLNTVHTNTQLMTDLNTSNKTVDNLMKESRKTIGAPPQRVMSNLQNTSEQTQEITNLISEASLGINRAELDTLNASSSVSEEMAKYRQDLQTAASTQHRHMKLDNMPMIPEGVSISSAPVRSSPSYPKKSEALITTVATQEPDMNDWYSVMQEANNNKS